jgi:signal transduction histidine kinase
MAVGAASVWITTVVLELERRELRARADAEQQAMLRLALWRMDSWLAPQLAREAARPYFEYQPYFSNQKAYTRILDEIAPGEVLTPSPLLGFRSVLFPAHFQSSQRSGLSSPQVPTGNLRDLTEATFGTDAAFGEQERALSTASSSLRYELLAKWLTSAESSPANCFVPAASLGDYANRAQTTSLAKQWTGPLSPPSTGGGVEIGPLLPIWLPDEHLLPSRLVFVRRASINGETVFQGFLVAWERLGAELLGQIADLFPTGSASLERVDGSVPAAEARMLATLPAVLHATPKPATEPPWTTTRTIMATAWGAIAIAILAVGITLRSAIAFGDRRARFASAVTHELRTPLTTFRMYSEMLASGMVRDPSRQTAYLATLDQEAQRLAQVVENVLCYARLEDGRFRSQRVRMTTSELFERCEPVLRRRAIEAGMTLERDIAPGAAGAAVEVDPDAVQQILHNLVDNASKYGRGGGASVVEFRAEKGADQVRLIVQDHGPGIPERLHRRVFRPFDRGARAAADSVTPGIGLGLALARGLARDLDGNLTIEPSATGARFVLTLRTV